MEYCFKRRKEQIVKSTGGVFRGHTYATECRLNDYFGNACKTYLCHPWGRWIFILRSGSGERDRRILYTWALYSDQIRKDWWYFDWLIKYEYAKLCGWHRIYGSPFITCSTCMRTGHIFWIRYSPMNIIAGCIIFFYPYEFYCFHRNSKYVPRKKFHFYTGRVVFFAGARGYDGGSRFLNSSQRYHLHHFTIYQTI